MRQEYPLWFEYEALAAAWPSTHLSSGTPMPEGGLYGGREEDGEE